MDDVSTLEANGTTRRAWSGQASSTEREPALVLHQDRSRSPKRSLACGGMSSSSRRPAAKSQRKCVLSLVATPMRGAMPKLVELPLTVSARLVAMLGPRGIDVGPLAAASLEVAARLLEGSTQLVQELHLPAAHHLGRTIRWGISQEVALKGLRRWLTFGRAVGIAGRAAPLLGQGGGHSANVSANLAQALAAAQTTRGRRKFVSTIAGA
eukprot:TRINITY_DN5187_c0_g1_i1.p1 TRINITY_DN5187_c0_g1~~TRINITY_DN5187_c0_g1_i1.p1  ORF type:complete len:210 (-),score=38.57 TRINITY_DN5187_c0_g1_i1:187-816(-)